MKIRTHPEVYEPREDTYFLLDHIKGIRVDKALEVGVGTGIIALTLAKTCKEVHGIDINPKAIEIARENARVNNIKNVKFWISDLFINVEEKYDLIVFNPPYLPGEPKNELERSWSGGNGGREVIDKFLKEVRSYLRPNGKFLILVSSLNKPTELAKKYKLKVVKQEKLFFEELVILEGYK